MKIWNKIKIINNTKKSKNIEIKFKKFNKNYLMVLY